MSCEDCPLLPYKEKGQYVPPSGDPATCSVVLIGEAPGRFEVAQGLPFVGPTGRVLAGVMKRVGLERTNCFITNAVKCKAPDNKPPPEAVACCRPLLAAELRQVPADVPWAAMGRVARDALFPGAFKKGVLSSRGWHRWPYAERWVLVTAHPAYSMYNPQNVDILINDLSRLMRGPQPPVQVEYDVIEEPLALLDVLHAIEPGSFVSFDLETDQVDFQRDRILCLTIGDATDHAFIIPDYVLYVDLEEYESWEGDEGEYPDLTPSLFTVSMLQDLWEKADCRWVGHNAKFDLRFLVGQLGVTNARVDFDTIVAHYALNEVKGGHDLKTLADTYFDVGDYESEVVYFAGKKSGRYSRVPRPVLYEYASMDAEVTRRLAYVFEKELRRQGLYERPFMFPMMAAIPMLLDMEIQGFLINAEVLERGDAEQIGPRLERVAAKLRKIAGEDFNPDSAVQSIDVAYHVLGLPKVEIRTRSKGKKMYKESTQKEVVDMWLKMREDGRLKMTRQQRAFVRGLKYYRHIKKMRTAYVDKWLSLLGPDGAVHPSYLLRGTVTGRLSAKDPPIQTVPSDPGDPITKIIPDAHVARPGYKILYADYSQAELRIAACLSQDEFMLRAFQGENPDYHSEVARAAYGPNFTKFQRDFCKRLTFGWLYGGNAYEIARDALLFSEEVARRFAQQWEEQFKGMAAWRRNQAKKMLQYGYVSSVLGRRRRYPLLTEAVRGEAQRQAMNMPIQSAASDMTLISAMRLHDRYKDDPHVRVLCLVHDSLLMEVREDKVEEVSRCMKQTMETTAGEWFPDVPHLAEVKTGQGWGDVL